MYIKVDWPKSQIYTKLNEEEIEEYDIIFGNDGAVLVPEDEFVEVNAICRARTNR